MSKKVGWLLDAEMFPDYQLELIDEIQSQGHSVQLVNSPAAPYRWDDTGNGYRNQFPAGSCVVAHGDIDLIMRIQEENLWTPGAFGTIDHYFCSHYFCRYGEFLLNRDYIMLPFGELKRCRQFLFKTLGVAGKLFVRPDSPLKLFAGQVISEETFAADLEFLGFYDFPESSLVVVSSLKTIVTEWRFVIAEGNVITGCQYAKDGRQQIVAGYTDAALKLATEIACLEPESDPVWICDLCETETGAVHLLEIGGFSFADLYACGKGAVVAAVSDVAWRLWDEHQK